MSMWDNLSDILGGGYTTAPTYQKGTAGYNYQQALLNDPGFSANLAAYKNPANWGYNTTSNNGESTSTDAFKSFQPTNTNPGLINIPGMGYVQPDYVNPNTTLQGGNIFSTPTGGVGGAGAAQNSYNRIGFDTSGNLSQNQRYTRPGNESFGHTLIHDIAPLAAFVLGGGALAGGFGAAGAGAAGGAGEAGAGGAGLGGGGFGSELAIGSGGNAGLAGSVGSATGEGFGSGLSIGNAGYGGMAGGGIGGTTGGEFAPMDSTGAFGGMDTSLGSGFNGLGLNSGISAGDISGYGSLSPSAGGVSADTFSGGIGSGAGGGLGNTLGSGFQGTGVNAGIDEGTAASQSGLRGLFNQAKGLYNSPIGQTYRTGSTLYDMYAANQKAKLAQQGQQDILNNYAPNSLYAQAMQRELAAKDAAAGRNSQYGPRALMLAQNLAQARGNAMQGGAYQGLGSTYATNKFGGPTSLSKLFGAGQAASQLAPKAISSIADLFG